MLRLTTAIWLAMCVGVGILPGCAPQSPVVPVPALSPQPQHRFLPVGVLPFSGPHGNLMADLLGARMQGCDIEIIPRDRLTLSGDAAPTPVEALPDRRQLTSLREHHDLGSLLAGHVMQQGESGDKYVQLIFQVRLIDPQNGRAQWSHRADLWSPAGSSMAGDLERAAEQIGTVLCREFGPP